MANAYYLAFRQKYGLQIQKFLPQSIDVTGYQICVLTILAKHSPILRAQRSPQAFKLLFENSSVWPPLVEQEAVPPSIELVLNLQFSFYCSRLCCICASFMYYGKHTISKGTCTNVSVVVEREWAYPSVSCIEAFSPRKWPYPLFISTSSR